MKVLFHTSFQVFQRANGGKTVFFKTKEALERAGVEVDVFDPNNCDFRKYDLIHSFTMESTEMWHFARSMNLKLAVTPISWFGGYARPRSRLARWVKRRIQSRILCPLHPFWWEECFTYPDHFFPQTWEQGCQLEAAFCVPRDRITVVHHGVDSRFATADPTEFLGRYHVGDFVLCVGRFEQIKNQISLIRALRDTGIPMVFIGRPDTALHAWCYEECVRDAPASTIFITDVEHDSPLLASAYAAARVVVLPSHRESPGLAALEGGLAGANVAITHVGGAREYFAEHASYLDPYSIESIRGAVLEAYRRQRPNRALQAHIRQNYLWENVVLRNVDGYRRIVVAAGAQ